MSRHDFTDPIHPSERVVLVIEETFDATGVEHPECARLAHVSPDLDAFYCQRCHWNGRISGAWFMDLWRTRPEPIDTCRNCGSPLPEHTDAYSNATPSDGDVSVCLYCAELSIFDHGRLRTPTDTERTAILDDPKVVAVIAAVVLEGPNA